MKRKTRSFMLVVLLISFLAGIIMALGIAGCDKNIEIEEKPFYTLEEAYSYGWLTKEDLKSIAYYLNGGRGNNEELMSETYQPLPKTPEALDDETKLEIKQAYGQWKFPDEDWSDFPPDPFYPYYGCYHDCVVISFSLAAGSPVAPGISWETEIGGVTFCYSYTNTLYVWRQKEALK